MELRKLHWVYNDADQRKSVSIHETTPAIRSFRPSRCGFLWLNRKQTLAIGEGKNEHHVELRGRPARVRSLSASVHVAVNTHSALQDLLSAVTVFHDDVEYQRACRLRDENAMAIATLKYAGIPLPQFEVSVPLRRVSIL